MTDFFWNVEIKGGPAVGSGPGSGHHGHAGRPGEVGGSLPSGGTADPDTRSSLQVVEDSFRRGTENYDTSRIYETFEGGKKLYASLWGLRNGDLRKLKEYGSHTESAISALKDAGIERKRSRKQIVDLGVIRIQFMGDYLVMDVPNRMSRKQKLLLEDMLFVADEFNVEVSGQVGGRGEVLDRTDFLRYIHD